MPKRKSLVFSAKDIAGARIIRPVDVGRGQNTLFSNDFFSGKIYLKRENFAPGKRVAQRVFLKEGDKSRIKGELRIRQKLKAAGLPVLKAGIVFIDGKYFMAIEPFLKKGGSETKLEPINQFGRLAGQPTFLEKITVEKNKKLIEDIAKDTAKAYNAGIYAKYFDFFGFYRKKDRQLERVIMDTELLLKAKNGKELEQHLNGNLRDIFRAMNRNKRALVLFTRTLEQSLQSKGLKGLARTWHRFAETRW
jgi:hypothetical protein